ncbi:uncharacterized protein Z518_03360 [Rhinocladiella mackenziei CBS 650.93]|uniref:Uncharacterized protein n=1 Tax=Rhinocladiella mackenziei CBS 650.93 TaxID=1442369 RepID=A0A0D2HDR8_9EURO|nr:uncharacterized protein Z518_03360 [Rhinocladiella mackenziei CBS 650.93]KIX08703.1 hypothetical protein Z518_03360 [Rhinocladiella mackenziei CBS 650.93]
MDEAPVEAQDQPGMRSLEFRHISAKYNLAISQQNNIEENVVASKRLKEDKINRKSEAEDLPSGLSQLTYIKHEEYIIITTYIDQNLQDELLEHTKKLKERKLITGPYLKETKIITTPTPNDNIIKKGERMYVVREKSRELDDSGSDDSLDDLLKRFTNLSEQERTNLPSYPKENGFRSSWMFT